MTAGDARYLACLQPQVQFASDAVSVQAVRWIAAGSEHMVAVTDTAVHSWGCNSMGQLGLGHFREQQQPAEILSLHGHKARTRSHLAAQGIGGNACHMQTQCHQAAS